MLTPMDTHTEALIKALTEKLAAHRADASAIWEALPGVYQEVTGGPLDRADPYQIMLCQCVLRNLVTTCIE